MTPARRPTRARIKRPAEHVIPARRRPQPQNVVHVSAVCHDRKHHLCTGRIYNAARQPWEPRFLPCDCTARSCPHGADTRARLREQAKAAS